MALRSRCITGSFRACSTIRSALTPDPLSRKSISLFSSRGQIPHHLSKAFKQVFRRGHAGAPHVPLELFRRTLRVPGAALLQQTRRRSTGRPGSGPFVRRILYAGSPRSTPADSPGATKARPRLLRNRTHSAAISAIWPSSASSSPVTLACRRLSVRIWPVERTSRSRFSAGSRTISTAASLGSGQSRRQRPWLTGTGGAALQPAALDSEQIRPSPAAPPPVPPESRFSRNAPTQSSLASRT